MKEKTKEELQKEFEEKLKKDKKEIIERRQRIADGTWIKKDK